MYADLGELCYMALLLLGEELQTLLVQVQGRGGGNRHLLPHMQILFYIDKEWEWVRGGGLKGLSHQISNYNLEYEMGLKKFATF